MCSNDAAFRQAIVQLEVNIRVYTVRGCLLCKALKTKVDRKYVYLNTQSVPRSKHSVSVIQTGQLMLYTEIIAVRSQIHTKHTKALCGQNVEL